MKEDVLEQIVDDYLQFNGYFTKHNIPFKPSTSHPEHNPDLDRVPSDVDVVAINPKENGPARVVVVSCKSWQTGFNPRKKLAELREGAGPKRRPTWQHFRELWIPKWSEAFRSEINGLTGQDTFHYRIAVTRFQGDDPEKWAAEWGRDSVIQENLRGCDIGFLTLKEMWNNMLAELQQRPAASEIGRLAQLLKAARLTAGTEVAPPAGLVPGSDAEALAEQEQNESP